MSHRYELASESIVDARLLIASISLSYLSGVSRAMAGDATYLLQGANKPLEVTAARMKSSPTWVPAYLKPFSGVDGKAFVRLPRLKTSGIISPFKWGNLLGGEIFTMPGEVNGKFVVDGVVGDYLCAKYGDIGQTPLTIHISGNRLVKVECTNKELEAEFWEYCHRDENSDRVGEFAIGTNIGLNDVIGNILQDEKLPGVHIAFGNPYGFHTGADWYSSTHIDVVGRRFDIWADGRQIMAGGNFLV
jgi:hypothetical protein